jgi:hypothetical protein
VQSTREDLQFDGILQEEMAPKWQAFVAKFGRSLTGGPPPSSDVLRHIESWLNDAEVAHTGSQMALT